MADVGTGYLVSFLISSAISIAVSYITAPNVKGPRQKDSATQGSDYGRPITRMWGPSNRLPGTVIWQGPLVPSKHKRSSSGGSSTTYSYDKSFAILLGKGVEGATLGRIWANKKLIRDADGVCTLAAAVRFYDGTQVIPDPTIEAIRGVGEVPAYVDSMYVVFDSLQFSGLGPPIPIVECEIIAHGQITVYEVVAEIGEAAGVTIDVSMLAGNVGDLDGYAITSESSAAEALAPLAISYAFTVAERRGAIVAVPRGMDPVATIAEGDTGAVVGGGTPTFANHKRESETTLPREVTVTFLDIARDLQPNTARATRNLGNAKDNINVSLPVALDVGQGKRVAHQLLWGSYLHRRTVPTTVSDRWLDVLPGDVVRFPTPASTYLPYRLERATRGADAVTEWLLGYEDAEIYNCAVIAASAAPTTPEGAQGAPGDTVFVPMDTSILRDVHDTPGFYWVVSGTSSDWRGSQLWRSADAGVDWQAVDQTAGGSTVGTVTGTVPDGPTYCWDMVTEIVVTLLRSGLELESLSDAAVLNGGNLAWIGDSTGVGGELLQFAEAELIGANQYRLTRLLRGRRGTEWTTASHGATETFVLLSDSANLKRQDFGAADLDLARLYKPVSVGVSIDDTDAETFTNTGEALRCFSPARLLGRRRSTGDVAISWHRRTRLMVGGFGASAPLGEDEEAYQLDIYADGSPDTPLRSLLLRDQTTYVYPAAEQAADCAVAGVPTDGTLALVCRQQSAVRGLGHPAESRVS